METINPAPGDNWCDLTEDELLTELRRGLDRAYELEQELSDAHAHASLAARGLQGLRKAELTAGRAVEEGSFAMELVRTQDQVESAMSTVDSAVTAMAMLIARTPDEFRATA